LCLLLNYLSPAGCTLNTVLVSCTLVSFVVFTALSISSVAEHGALLTSAVVASYVTFLAYSALSSVPDPECNPLAAVEYDDLRLAVGLVFAAISVAYCAWSYGARVGESRGDDEGPKVVSVEYFDPYSTLSHPGRVGADGGSDSTAAPGEHAVSSRVPAGPDGAPMVRGLSMFHAIMFAVACYASMLITGWRSAVLSLDVPVGEMDGGTIPYQVTWASVWIQVASLVATVLLYTWTLVAPALFPDREFG